MNMWKILHPDQVPTSRSQKYRSQKQVKQLQVLVTAKDLNKVQSQSLLAQVSAQGVIMLVLDSVSKLKPKKWYRRWMR